MEIGVRYDVNCSTVNPIKHGLEVLVRVLKDIELNKPIYCFTLPGIVFGMLGIYLGACVLQIFATGGRLNFGPIIIMLLLVILGTFMSLTGLLLHSMVAILTHLYNWIIALLTLNSNLKLFKD